MKHPFKLVFIGLSVLFFGVLFANAEHVIDDSKNTGYLFVISGTSGSLDGDTLTLNGVPNVLYFSDRPARKAGHLSVSEFIEMWDKGVDSFKADPPNATLAVLKEDGAKDVVVELISVVQKSDSVIFKVAVLEGTIPESFRTTSLFIDFQSNTPTL
ncbi:MAG: hypothetical protein E2O70_06540 [Candidatus Dadabacteria bacterium]|nr:hypothetical protein [Candidatus Dadabacteria bacterium]TDJ00052.1 MAG: hypothetical protein E2O70_06540 [Candidatus Dadabacteria bacterium]